jgi:signal transduction histidine kinase
LLIALLIIWLLDALLILHRDLESKIVERTAQLEHAVAEQARLERELLEAGARERISFGRELHDEIGQHLVATALAVQALALRLTGPLATEATAIVDWTEQAVAKTRSLARGLLLAEIAPQRLIPELEELASVARHARIALEVEHDDAPIDLRALDCAQIFRIAQEAVSNAVRHAQATRITISVARRAGAFSVTIEDDGIGIPDERTGGGMGLQIMTQRARLIGARVLVEKRESKGTRVTCTLPVANQVNHG